MKVFKMAEIMADEGICVFCKDADGVQWFGTGSALYPAHGWPELNKEQVKEMLDAQDRPFGWTEPHEARFPQMNDVKPGHKCFAERLDLRVRTDKEQTAVVARTHKGIVFINEKFIEAVDKAGAKDIRLREMVDCRGILSLVAEDPAGKQYAIIAPIAANKTHIDAFRAIQFQRFYKKPRKKDIRGIMKRVKKYIIDGEEWEG